MLNTLVNRISVLMGSLRTIYVPTLANALVSEGALANYSSSVEFPLLLNRGTTIHKIPTTFV